MVGGFDFNRSTFNRVTQAWRQPGSNIKPFVYAAALERGLTPATLISDQPFLLTAQQTGGHAWQPKNDDNQYEAMLTLRQGLYRSRNMVSIRILQAITPQYAQDYLTRFDFEKNRWPPVLPLVLGAGGATPLQVVNAYSVFANGGYQVAPYLIDHVTDRSGKVLMQAQPMPAGAGATRSIDPRTAWLMDDLLHGVVVNGTGARVYKVLKRHDVAGKTGTANDAVDVWFSGYTPALATTVWMGFDQPRSLGSNEYGSGLALSTWLDYMQPMLAGVAEQPPRPRPEGLILDNGEYYYAEFPPGQAVASLDLPSGDALNDFLNNARNSEDAGTAVRPTSGGTASLPPNGSLPAAKALTTLPRFLPIPIPEAEPARPL
jgi:penicillin-binding protein 1A